VFKLTHVYFYHPEETRVALKRAYSHNDAHRLGGRIDVDDRMRGIPVRGDIISAKGSVQRGVRDAYAECYKILDKSELFKKDDNGKAVPRRIREQKVRSAVKFDFNRAIGVLKNGRFTGGIVTRNSTDIINLMHTPDGKTDVYTFQGIPFPKESLAQISTRELPNSDMVLSEMTYVTPVAVAGYPRSLRIDILERARLVMDLFTIKSNAFMVKTDAVFFKDKYLDEMVKYMAATFPTKFVHHIANYYNGEYVCGDDIRESFDECKGDGCRPNKFCSEHSVFEFNESFIPAMMPVKFIFHPGMSGDVIEGVSNAVEDAEGMRYVDNPDAQPSNLKMSTDGREQLIKSLQPLADPVCVYTSELMPTFEDVHLENGIVCSAAQSMGEDPTVFVDEIEKHCLIYGSNGYVFLGEEGEAQAYLVQNKVRNALYMQNIFETIDSFDGQGFLMEGPPGVGKSFAVSEYIKREAVHAESIAFFVATATHLTLAPYKPLEEYVATEMDLPDGVTVNVSTVHSLIGVFNQMEEACRNPPAWFGDDQTKFRSRFARVMTKTKAAKAIIFIDEYEMLPLCMEEMLLYFSRLPNVRLILLGDKYQTAAFGKGVRCSGDVIRHVTNNTRIEFDLPFRNPDYEYNKAQKDACNGRPTLFLEPPLADYKWIESRADDVYTDEIDRIAHAYIESAAEHTVYRDPVVSVQNYKAIGVVTMDIMARVAELSSVMSPEHAVPFCGTTHCSVTSNDTGELGSVDQEAGEVGSESYRQLDIAEHRFEKEFNHLTGDPVSKKFLVGTKMAYVKGFSYRAMTAFVPKLSGTTKDKKQVKQDPVRMGQVMVFGGEFSKTFTSPVPGHPHKTQRVELDYAVFHADTDHVGEPKPVYLLKAEMLATMYYPFCLYTEGVVGHTFDRYSMIKFSSDRAYSNDYAPLKKGLEEIENVLGDKSWLAPIVKTMNVAVSRLTFGNRLRVIEINEGKKGFWRDTLSKSKWHIVSEFGPNDSRLYLPKLVYIRNIVVQSTKSVQYNNELRHLYRTKLI
jgi:hypothetical protein